MKGKSTVLRADGSVETIWHATEVELEQLQAAVGGFIEIVPGFDKFHGEKAVAFCNEAGKLHKLPVNETATLSWASALGHKPSDLNDVLVGDVIVLTGDEDFLETI